jgi:hypothetical protein
MKTQLFGLSACSALLLVVVAAWAAPSSGATPAPWAAKWIWKAQADTNPYNQMIVARKRFTVDRMDRGVLRITADSFYRLYVNGQWVNDGPCRAWAEHFQYDVIDVTPYLRVGKNEIRVLARYFGVGDFHRVPKQAGLLAELHVARAGSPLLRVATDSTWEVAESRALVRNVPKQSIQMEPAEIYDARLEDQLQFAPAQELFAATEGPWKNLHPRDVALLTRQPVSLAGFVGAKVVKAEGANFCMPVARLVNPGVIEANNHASCACGMATILENAQPLALALETENMRVSIDGRQSRDGRFDLAPGQHLVLAFVRNVFGHDKEKAVRLRNTSGYKLVNPLEAADANPWCFIRFPEYAYTGDDLVRNEKDVPRVQEIATGYPKAVEQAFRTVKNKADFVAQLGKRAERMPAEQMFVEEISWKFHQRKVVSEGAALVDAPTALIAENPELTTVRPSPAGDVELLYDLGAQNCGYWAFEVLADAGVAVDIFAVEYITPDGRIQHTGAGYRNGMRYITCQGRNLFTSLKRRSGRYLFVTLRNQKTPVRFRRLHLIESTYPVSTVGYFTASDARLEKIWEISTRTLKLCMEDTYTDCPLYEQTHWVGDARNESLFGYSVFGATDLGRRCIRLTAQSLEHYPIAGCQTPSSWDVLLPAWSFLWGISTWDYYWATGDKQFLREVYPSVIRNLKGAEKLTNEQGLFSGPFWNMFDWSGADQGPKTVVHNSMFVVGAIDAALKDAEVLGETQHTAWLKAYRARLVAGINRLWDEQKQSYPDSIHDDGKISPSTCQHTSFLSILYDIVEPAHRAAAKKNLLDPPAKMVRIGSPFAVLYLYETLEKLGLDDEIIRQIYANYLPMLESGATTVWESFPSGTTGRGGFPTRSHCHAWSSAPSYFLNRIVLGIKPTSAGVQTVDISPRLAGLTWARGAVATPRGPIHVSWTVTGDVLDVTCSAPEGVQVKFVKNASHAGKSVKFNGTAVP